MKTLFQLVTELKHLWFYRDLIHSLVIRDLRIKYKSSFLGFFWSLLHPLLIMGVYSIIFSILIRQVVNGPYPIFLLAGILPWLFFSSSLTLTAPSLLANRLLINKVYFPREVLPLAIIVSNLVNFILSLVVFMVFMLPFGIIPGVALLSLPLIILFHVMFTFGMSLLLAIANVYFRDLDHIIDIVLQLWFFSVPVIYSMDFLRNMVGQEWLVVYQLNPMVFFVTMYRDILMYGQFPSLVSWTVTGLWGILVFILGFWFFKKHEFDAVKEI